MSDADNFSNSFQSFVHFFEICIVRKIKPEYVDLAISSVIGKKANLDTGVSRKQCTPNFPKNVRVCIKGEEMFVFWKIWLALSF